MSMAPSEHDTPLKSPFGRVFVRSEIDQVINCAMGLLHPVDVPALKAALSATVVARHPRFSSLLVGDPRRSSHLRWRKTTVNIDDHIVVLPGRSAAGDEEAAVNAYLADLAVSPPLSSAKPLWEVHVLVGPNCVVLRVHHAVGDGISLMSLVAGCFRTEAVGGGRRERAKWRSGGLWGMMKSAWYTAVYEAAYVARLLGVRDERTVVSGGEGVELWPRAVSTAKFKVDDMKDVKKALPNVTMNDVLMGVVSSGLVKYLHKHSPKEMLKGIKMTSLVAANTREQSGLLDVSNLTSNKSGSPWGNKFGMFLVPIHCGKEEEEHPIHPLQHVTRMKSIMDRKKQSFEAHLSHFALGLSLSIFGPKVSSWFYRRMLNATTLLISNIVGPQEEIAVAGNPVKYIKICISSLSQAITLHLVSYKERADLQVSVAKDVIQDGEFLARCFEEALLEMKNAARRKAC